MLNALLTGSPESEDGPECPWIPLDELYRKIHAGIRWFEPKTWHSAIGVRIPTNRTIQFSAIADVKPVEPPFDTPGYVWFDIGAARDITKALASDYIADHLYSMPAGPIRDAAIGMLLGPGGDIRGSMTTNLAALHGITTGFVGSEKTRVGPAHMPIMVWMGDVKASIDDDGHAAEHGAPVFIVDVIRSQGIDFPCQHEAAQWFAQLT